MTQTVFKITNEGDPKGPSTVGGETTSRLAGSLDFRPFFAQRNRQNTDLNNQNTYSWGPIKSQKRAKKEHTHGKN